MMTRAKRGIYAAAITPLTSSGDIDLPALAQYCSGLLASGCDGVAPLGTTGEAPALAFDVRVRVPEALAAAGLPADAVLLGVGSSAVADVIAMARASLAVGYSNLLVLPPFYTKQPSEGGLFDYYARLIETVADDRLRVYLYHIPQVTAVPISLALVHRLRARFGSTIAGIKDSSGDFESAKSYLVVDDFDVYPSTEAVLTDALEAGCAGVISGTTNVSGSLAQAVLSAPAAERARLQPALTDVRLTLQRFPLIPAVKQIQAWRVADGRWLAMLPPLRPLSGPQIASLRTEAERLGMIERDRNVA